MTREEAIAILNRYDVNFYNNDGHKIRADKICEALDMAIKALETWNNLFKSYEVLTQEITESGENATKRIDDWCIEQLRGILGDYYADLIIKESEI